ncbi:hypothetical protein Hanom_Chr12g01144881 [Helianthus anomalus]
MLDAAVEDKIMAATETKIEELQAGTKDNEENKSVVKRKHLFGRQKPLHAALGSGKSKKFHPVVKLLCHLIANMISSCW